MSLTELVFLLLCFPVSWSFGWVMRRRLTKLELMIQLEQVLAQTKELKRMTAHLEALMKEIEK